MAFTFSIYHYDDLTKLQLYQLLSLRSEVFVVEQHCHYQDLDFYDHNAYHLMAHQGDELVGCARILPPGSKREHPSIGRYALRKAARGAGQGKAFFTYAIDELERLYFGHAIYIQAQYYLERLYQSMGFESISEPYDYDGIEHVDMIRPAK